jgi:hypothetical protein
LPRTSRGSPAQSGTKLYSNPASRSDSTACAASPAQDSGHDAAAVDDSDEPDNDPDTELEELEDEVLEEHATAYAASLAQAVEKLTAGSNHRGRTATATACAGLPRTSRGSSAKATPRNELRGQNPQDRSTSDRTARAAIDSNDASHSDATACAAPPAQAFPVSLRHPGPYGISAPSATGSNPAPQPGFSGINLIYRPAIRNDGKP